ncbi:transposase [Streptomyces scopuliridis]|uniref:transposase n=1 Tax=Streptomyces scopuliridis TaxID=452529 RepID=UPI00368F874C
MCGKLGRPSVHSERQLINGIRFRTRTGIPWRDLPRTNAKARGGRCTGCSAAGSATAPGAAPLSSSRPGPTRAV